MLRSALRHALIAAVGAGALALPAAAAAAPVTPVPKLDTQQYLGQWRQIASIPQWFEVLCDNNTVANYSLNADGTVRVVNRCLTKGGFPVTVRGRARVLDKTTGAQLQVTFLNLNGGWVYFGNTPNYIVMGLAPDYRWAIVGDPSRRSAFVLSRGPALAPADKTQILSILKTNGFNACSLKTTPQRGGLSTVQPFCN